MYNRKDELDPLPYFVEWPSLRSKTGRVDVHSLVAFGVNQSKVNGVYLEFGVASGRSAISAIRASRLYGEPSIKDFFLFDSFKGLPKLEGRDKLSLQFNEGDFAFSKEEVISQLKKYECFFEDNIKFIEGYFHDSLNKFRLEDFSYNKVAVLHIDVDLYESCNVVLKFVKQYLQTGSIIMFDDWNCFNASDELGERGSVKKWLFENPNVCLKEYASYGWHGKVFIVEIYKDWQI